MPNGRPTFGSNAKFFVDGEISDRKGRAVDPGECIIFKVTDEDLLEILDLYADLTDSSEHEESVTKLFNEVESWQAANQDRVKTAD